jgi:uncharacterized protein
MRILTNLTAVLLALFYALPARAGAPTAPSFDCAKARTTIETLICSDPELSALDRQISDAYNKARKNAPMGSALRSTLLDEQRQYLKARVAACKIPDQQDLSSDQARPLIACLREQFSMRLKTLQDTHDPVINDTPKEDRD